MSYFCDLLIDELIFACIMYIKLAYTADDKDVIVKYANRLFSCNQHTQLLLYIAP